MTATVIVTGAAGFIGSALSELLLARGYYVLGIDNFRTGKRENLSEIRGNKRFRLLEADVTQNKLSEDVIKALSQAHLKSNEIDIIFHLAAISSVKESIENPVLMNETNVRGTINILEMVRRLEIKRFVFSSSAAVYGNPEKMPIYEEAPCNPLSPYAASKIAGELYIHSYNQLYNIGGTILRYFNVYGPRQAYSEYSGVISIFTNQALRNEPITVEGTGEQTRSFIYVEDIARATLAAGERDTASGMTINLSGTESISISNLAQFIRQNVEGSESEVIHVNPRPGDVKDSIGSMERAGEILQFNPEVRLEEGLRKTIDWYKTHQSSK
ncbi:MAG: SDR family NAD(P)-dependent oxidoreductase [Candidatus Thorarchaeota archaeon]|nr:SDR family NAD(P)-dependent oxidoreductase [Candidatus Thorarchaeota archaeon]